jgi:PAS domain S-box-containing protein
VRRRTAQFETLLNQAPIGVFLVDGDFLIQQLNPAATRMFGNIPGPVGHSLENLARTLWTKAHADEMVERFRHTLETGEPCIIPERAEQRIDRGIKQYYEWRIDRIPLPESGHGVVCYFRDISNQVKTREALKEADRRKDEFLATLAHELRNPLAPIRNCLQILRMSNGSGPATPRLHEMMERQIAHMVRLVDDLLELSRISRGTIELKKDRVSLENILSHAIETSRPMIEAADHELEVDSPAEPVLIEGDMVRLSQVFANLLNNAAKYTHPGGKIVVRAKCNGSELIASIRDNGIGIPSHMLTRVFEMFTQVDNSLRRAHDGLGIGLSLVRTIVTMHGGTVEAHSKGPGLGSEFIVRLPLTDPKGLTGVSNEHPLNAPNSAQPCRILIVDDNKDAADSLAMLLKLLGADVHLAYDGPSALAALPKCQPRAMLLDIGMPGMSGYEVAKQVRNDSRFCDISLIALTGWGQEIDRRNSQEVGFDHHLVKPVDSVALQMLLASLAEKSASSPQMTAGS